MREMTVAEVLRRRSTDALGERSHARTVLPIPALKSIG